MGGQHPSYIHISLKLYKRCDLKFIQLHSDVFEFAYIFFQLLLNESEILSFMMKPQATFLFKTLIKKIYKVRVEIKVIIFIESHNFNLDTDFIDLKL